jgi:hypothetical protein
MNQYINHYANLLLEVEDEDMYFNIPVQKFCVQILIFF